MNSELQMLFARRSVRRYTREPVTEDQVRDLLEAAMAAPSAAAKDPWHFIVVRQPETLARIARGLTNGKFLADAGVGIVVCGDLKRAHGGELSYLIQDLSAAIENLLLAASLLGLDVSTAAHARAVGRAAKAMGGIRTGVFKPQPGAERCGACDYRLLCGHCDPSVPAIPSDRS